MAFETLKSSFGRLSARERMLVGLCGAAIVAFILILVVTRVSASLSRLTKRVDNQDRMLIDILKAQLSFGKSRAADEARETLLKRPPPPLRTFLEELAKKNNMSIKEYRDLPTQRHGKKGREVEETSIMVYPDLCALRELAGFLADVENNQQHFVLVKDLKMDRDYEKRSHFRRVEIQVSGYRLVEASAQPTSGAR